MGLADIALGAGRASANTGRQVVDIIEFIEAPWGLNMQLFPVQRVILKTYYGIPLDNNPHKFPLDAPIDPSHPGYHPDLLDVDGFYKYRVVITDWRRENPRHMTEEEYLALLFKEERCNVGTVTPGHERREMVLSIGRRSGKCVTGDTLVLTDRGIFPIKDLGDSAGPEYQPLDVGVVQEAGKRSRSAYFYNGGVKSTYRVQSYTGLAIEGTANHRVKVLGADGVVAWRYLDDIRENDILAVHRSSNLWANEMVDVRAHHVSPVRQSATKQPDVFDERWGLLMGYLVGDGSWTNRVSLAITVEHPETKQEVEDLLRELCGKASHTPDLRTAQTGVVRTHDKALRAFLHNLGFRWDVQATTKTTPWVVMRSPKHVVRAYLQGLFETDGSVTANGRIVSFCTASAQLARETQMLLLNFGVVSRIRIKHDKRLSRDYHEVVILGLRSRTTFAQEIGFRSNKKQGRLEAGLTTARKEGGDTESIPHQREWVQRLLASVPKSRAGWQRSTLRAILGNVCKPGSSDDLTYACIQALLPVARDLGADPEVLEHFAHLLVVDYFYDPVVSVGQGEAPVFDLNVPDGASFVANGLTNHNTTISACVAAYETYRLISKGDPQGYYGLPASNNIQLISVATDKDQAGLLYQEVSGHFRNCFSAETEVITADGVKPIGSLAGTTPTLLTGNGSWVQAPVRSFGQQQLYKLTLTRQGVEKVIYATANHRWFARDARKAYRGKGFQDFTTSELRPGKHHLQSMFGPTYKNHIDPSPFGVAHGFTFGDGSTVSGGRNANTAMMIGEKDAHLRPYFALCPMREVPAVNGVEAAALPNFFRDPPSIRENKAYLLGWLQGYFAADGSVSNGHVLISSAKRENIEFVRDVCAILGIGTYGIRSEERVSNLTGRPYTMYKMALMRGTLDESFFLIPAHRVSFTEAGGSNVQRSTVAWTVQEVEPTDRFEDVYCATVEGIGSFTLDGNILTGNCGFFAPYTANNTQSYARFQSPKDIERYGSYREDPTSKATLKVTFRSCVAKGLRGAGNIVVILDEMAHFTDNGQSSADSVYKAVVPSTAAFSQKDPRDRRKPIGVVESKVIAISSPLGRQGLFYQLFQDGFRGGKLGDNRLCVQAPTWEVNPTVTAEFFESEYVKDVRAFDVEYGARFSDRTRGWIEEAKDLLACVEPDARPRLKAAPRAPHFMGVDIGLVGDATAVAIGHIDEKSRIVVDLVDYIKAGEGDYEGMERLDFAEVADWIFDHTRRFFITEGMFDQWAGIPLEQALAAKGLKQLTSVHHTPQLTSQMFQNFKDMMFDKRLVLYDWPVPEKKTHCEYIEQLLELQAEYKSRNITIVQAPKIAGKHDDLGDALVRMVWLASQHVGKFLSLGTPRAGTPQAQMAKRVATQAMMQARRKAFQTGSSPDRQVPKAGNRPLGFGRGGNRGGGGSRGGGLGGMGGFSRWGK